MSNIYKIKYIEERKPTLFINPNTANCLGISRKRIISISFGSLRFFASINKSSEVPEEEIRLSNKLFTDLHLPDYLEFEIKVNQNEMSIGPYIGLLMSRKDIKLTPSRLEQMKIYVRTYEELHGAVIIFALDKVDAISFLVEGYCYNPVSKNFEKGIFPFPSSIYRTIGLSDNWKNCFLSVLGDRVFNSHYFNKWDMYQWFSQNTDLSSRIPFSLVYQTPQSIFDALVRFKKIYVKPVSGLGGRGIMQISHNQGAYVFKYRENGVNHKDILEYKDQAADYIKYKFSHGRYLVQQAIDLIQYKGGVVDFRCVMQKDQSGKWVCKTIIGRYGDRDSIVSNISCGGTAFRIDEIVKRSIPLPTSIILKDGINDFALQICNVLDEYGLNCGTLGLDIGVDLEEKIWLIEINNRDPDPSIALDVHDLQLYYELKTGPLFYAKFLAGF